MGPLVGLGRQQEARQVHLVQPLHDHHNGAGGGIVEARAQRAVEPLVGRLALGVGERLVGRQRIVHDQRVAPLPVAVPPIEVEIIWPR